MIQRRGWVVTDYKNRQKFSALQLMSISHISTQKYWSDHSEPIYITIKISPIGGRIRNHSVQSEHVLGILKLYFCLFQKNEIIFSYLFFLFCNYLLSKQLYFNK